MKVLDVGCGQVKRGDVGVDIVQYPGVDVCLDIDRESLPFPDSSFDLVVSFHFLEHVNNPAKVLREMMRVTRSRAEVRVPHRYSRWACLPAHKSVFNKAWFLRFAERYGYECRAEDTVQLFWIFPIVYEVHAELWKHEKEGIGFSLADLDFYIDYYSHVHYDAVKLERYMELRREKYG